MGLFFPIFIIYMTDYEIFPILTTHTHVLASSIQMLKKSEMAMLSPVPIDQLAITI